MLCPAQMLGALVAIVARILALALFPSL